MNRSPRRERVDRGDARRRNGKARPPQPAIAISEAAERLHVSEDTVRRLLRERKLHHVRVGRRLMHVRLPGVEPG